MARKFKINRKYTHFCMSKVTNKIVDGWEYPKNYDRQDIMAFYRIDMADNDRKIKDYDLMSVRACQLAKIDPFDTANWGNN